MNVGLYLLLRNLCGFACVINCGVSCLQSNKHLSVKQRLVQVNTSGTGKPGSKGCLDKSNIGGNCNRLATSILYTFLLQNIISSGSNEVGEGLNGNLWIIICGNTSSQFRKCLRGNLLVSLLLDAHLDQRVLNLRAVLHSIVNCLINGKLVPFLRHRL